MWYEDCSTGGLYCDIIIYIVYLFVAESNKIVGRAGIYSHLYGFNGDLNRVPPFCGVAERVLYSVSLAPAVLLDDTHNGEITRIMQIIQDEYAVSLLGEVNAFKSTCLELCGNCPFRYPALEINKRPIGNKYRVYDIKQKANVVASFDIDSLVLKAVEEEACFKGEPVICQPEFAVVTVPGLALGEVRIGRKYKESFLGVVSRTLRSPLVDLMLYHTSFVNGQASLAHYELPRMIDVL